VVAHSSSCCCCLKGERDSPRCNHSSEDKSILLPPIYGTTRGPPTSLTIASIASSWTSLCTTLYGWMTSFWVGFQPTLYHFIWMDDKFLGWLGFNPLCTTLYGWMTSFWVGFQLTLYHFIWMDDKFLG
jgi:hypothetical protein